MRLSSLRCCLIGALAVTLCRPQPQTGVGNGPPPAPRTQPADGTARPPNPARAPNFNRVPDPEVSHNTLQSDERLLQWAHEQNLEDTSRLVKLSTELKWDLANHDREVLSLATLKKMDEIERLVRKLRARVAHK